MPVDLEDYSLARVIKGIYDTTYTTIAVDEDGNIIGVFKGDYAGALKTIAVDSQGRIQAVLTDPEDVFGNPSYMGAAELAVRLGSINIYERRGTTVFMEDFEGAGLFWTGSGAGTGNVQALSTAWGKSGSQSCELTAGAGALGQARIYREFYVPLVGLTGIESSFTVDAATDYVHMHMRYYDGSGYKSGGLRYDRANTKIEYQNSSNVWTELIASYELNTTTKQFNTWKLILDLENTEYERMLINDKEEDMDGVALYDTGTGGTEHLYVNIRHDSAHDDAKTIYIDNVILTTNEP